MLWLVFSLPLAVLAGVLIMLARQSGAILVERSRVIAVAPQAAFEVVRDLRGWPDWSPWLLHEPEAKLEYSADPAAEGGWYRWDGRLIGAGRIEHRRLLAPGAQPDGAGRIEQRIVFERPFRSAADVAWNLAPVEGGTEVTWCMQGRMPFLLRFLAPAMARMTGKDYELGLVRLRARLDPEAPRFRLRFIGVTGAPPQTALTIPFDGGIDAMVAAMEQGFPRLAAAAAGHGIEPAGSPFTAYHVADTTHGHFEGDLALPVPEGTPAVADDSGELVVKRLGGGFFYAVEVQGGYEFLELAWYAAMGHLRMVKQKWDRGRASLEVYDVEPSGVASSDEIRTRILVPVR